MALRFSWTDIPERSRGLTFDDLLLVPKLSQIRSRKDPDLSTQLTKNIRIQIPIVSANMDTVTEAEMAIAMHNIGGVGIIHRFMTIAEQVNQVEKTRAAGVQNVIASIGVNSDEKERAKAL